MEQASSLLEVVMIQIASLVESLLLPAMVAGHWEGSLSIRGGELQVGVDLARDDAGGFKGDFDIPRQGVHNLELTRLSVDPAS